MADTQDTRTAGEQAGTEGTCCGCGEESANSGAASGPCSCGDCGSCASSGVCSIHEKEQKDKVAAEEIHIKKRK